MHWTSKIFGGARMCSRSSITMPSFVGLRFHPPPGRPKTLSVFICLSVNLSVTLLKVAGLRQVVPMFYYLFLFKIVVHNFT